MSKRKKKKTLSTKSKTPFGIATSKGVKYEGKIYPYSGSCVFIQNGEKCNKASWNHKPFKFYFGKRVHFDLNLEEEAYNVWLVDKEGNHISESETYTAWLADK